MRALLTDSDRFPFDEEDRAALASAGVELVELPGHDPEEIAAAGHGVHAIFIYYGNFTRDLIERLNGCRVLARCGTGYDNIDVAAAAERGIEVVYVPDYGIDDVADHTIALLLTCARKVALCDRAVRRGEWPGYGELRPMRRLRGRTLGLLGFGRIARGVATRAGALGLELAAHDPFVEEGILREHGVRPLDRDELFRRADILSVHVPLTEATRHLVGPAELALMKPGGILVNTSRGQVVDSSAVAVALAEGRLAGAGLDVFETAPLPADDPLRRHETVVFTPHSAAYTEEALGEVRKRPLADVLRVLGGEPPLNPVPK
jgi:D-3-phosphoglycerate dehydrogenase